jgi:hypothetical protein
MPDILPVRSKEKTTSALGGTVGIVTSLVSTTDSPGFRVALNSVGEMLAPTEPIKLISDDISTRANVKRIVRVLYFIIILLKTNGFSCLMTGDS